jgi:hypothetical protein
VDLPEKRIFCIIKQGKKTREVTSPGPWPLIFEKLGSKSKSGDRRNAKRVRNIGKKKKKLEVLTTVSGETT